MRRYRVIGTRPFREHAVGEEFVAEFENAAQEERALKRGNIEIVGEEPNVAESLSGAVEGSEAESGSEPAETPESPENASEGQGEAAASESAEPTA